MENREDFEVKNIVEVNKSGKVCDRKGIIEMEAYEGV